VHRLTGIPFSFTAHGSDLHVDRRMLDVKVAASAFAVTISEYNKEVMVATCGEQARSKIHIVRCGVDASVFSPPEAKAAGRPFQVTCVASFEEVKGHRYLLGACALLHSRGVDFRCHLVGDGPLRKDIVRWISEARLDNHVILHGSMARPDVARLLASSEAAVLASYPTKDGKREGIPVALMEAMACRLPVVATAISGIPELVETGVTGYLVPPCDAMALADGLEALASDERLREQMGAAGRDRVLREFNIHQNSKRLLELFVGRSEEPAYRGAGEMVTFAVQPG
jgi:colanic acid/amylovoran biosynthesis glycosyltransferase